MEDERTPLTSTSGTVRRRRRRGSSQVTSYSTSREVYGIALVSCSAFCFSLMALLVRMGAVLKEARFPSFQLVLSRSLVQFIAATGVLLWDGQNPLGSKEMRVWLLARAVAGGLGIVCLFFALTRLGLGECMVLVFTMPIFTIVFANIFLGERLEPMDGVFGVLCLLGIVLVAKPHLLFAPQVSYEEKNHLVGVCAAIAAALAQASIYIVIKKMGASVHYMMNIMYLGLLCTIVAPIGGYVFGETRWHMPHTVEEWVVFLGVGIFGLLAQICISIGLQKCRAGLGALVTNLQILFSFILGIMFLDEIPGPTATIGAVIILTSTVGVVLNKIMHS